MTKSSELTKQGERADDWQPHLQHADKAVETIEMRSGATLILSRFDPGAPNTFSHTEPEDVFGFGFHVKGGARFQLEDGSFETCPWDVWSIAAPRGSTSKFILPASGFLTASIRFDPDSVEAFFADSAALPQNARTILRRAGDDVGKARLPPLAPAASETLQSMFSTQYINTARHLYLESCALDLLAGQIANSSDTMMSATPVQSRHRDKAFDARGCLDKRLKNPPTIAELAKLVGTNEFTLKRSFKQTHGVTIFAYVSRRRMEHATALLQQGASVTSTAYEVGYECVRSFSAAYRRETGVLPSAIQGGSC